MTAYFWEGGRDSDLTMIGALTKLWDTERKCPEGRTQFVRVLETFGFKDIIDGCFKHAMISPSKSTIVKFDAEPEKRFTNEHTWGEFQMWHDYPKLHKHLARIFLAYHGLIVQEYLGDQCWMSSLCKEGKKLGAIIKTSHYRHHVHSKDGNIKFFDYDRDYEEEAE